MTITHKGASIYYTDQGHGSPLLLLHGFLENHTMWEPFLQPLTANHRVVCVDLLGHGKSECIGYLHTMEDMAAAIYELISYLQLEPVTIIGHSMGGYVGLAFAKAYPQSVKGLCLLNSTPEPDSLERKAVRTRANEMARTHYEQLVRMSFVNLFDNPSKSDYHKEIDQALQEALKTTHQGYVAANSGMKERVNFSKFWKELNIKKGMILGREDWIIDSSRHKRLYESETDFFKMINGGHMLHITNQEQTVSALLQFLE